MAIHFLAGAVVVKRPLLQLLFRLSPLLWPFNIYLPLARQLPGMCNATVAATSLLLFRLRRIVAARVPRYRRALRLLQDELDGADGVGRRRAAALDDGSLQSLLSVAI
ncbi:unnamed protein product [Spirodela intermedia]|uniref:Uncharacterized protein n=2 Tax=Spirodela intermedia TaxID=51605 RepID=A0A7I8JS30_SPIIN|nr:unnamed protein product [Spirodela intermedia]CAA6672571.1 unnamed protein product [Spirodela intermedia]CAA7409798.1 unnamed protein product [Spirodela intermedia]